MRIQNDRQQRGQPALDGSDLAHNLGVTPQRWQQACMAHRHRHLVSLQTPIQAQATGSNPVTTHLESLPAQSRHQNDPQLSWLKTALKSLDPLHRRWLWAHWVDGLSITAIARHERVDRRTLQRLLHNTLQELLVFPMLQVLLLNHRTGSRGEDGQGSRGRGEGRRPGLRS